MNSHITSFFEGNSKGAFFHHTCAMPHGQIGFDHTTSANFFTTASATTRSTDTSTIDTTSYYWHFMALLFAAGNCIPHFPRMRD